MTASNQLASDTPITPRMRFFVGCLRVITFLCALLFLLACGFEWVDEPRLFLGGTLIIGFALAVTLPPAILCTALSLAFVGPRRCKLAWISLCTFALPFIIAMLLGFLRGNPMY